jgi:hypothetical protein
VSGGPSVPSLAGAGVNPGNGSSRRPLACGDQVSLYIPSLLIQL